MPSVNEKFDFENGVYKAKCTMRTIDNLQKISVIQILDLKGNTIMTFKKNSEA